MHVRLRQEVQEVLRSGRLSQRSGEEVRGFRAAGVACGIKPSGALDLALIASDRPAAVAGVFTTNRFLAAPVRVTRPRVRRGRARAVVVNSGISNVAMGARGMRDAREMTRLAASVLDVPPGEVLVASTGVIGQPLPMSALRAGIPRVAQRLSPAGFARAARAILTTDTKIKLARASLGAGRLLGLAKGSGMIMPNMATMLAFVVTDLAVELGFLRRVLREVADRSFNRLTIDGEMSTSDSLLVLANGAAGGPAIEAGTPRARDFTRALDALCEELTEKLARDGEGVTRLADVIVSGARSDVAAERVARSIANSALVKTALFGGDPNWGRIVQAIGAAGVPLRPRDVGIRIAGIELLCAGEPAGDPKAFARAERAVKRRRFPIEVTLGSGPGTARVLTTDLSYDYVRINAEYTT